MEGAVSALAHQLVDSFEAEGRVELMARFCSPLPVTVIADILGVSRADAGPFGHWAMKATNLELATPWAWPPARREPRRLLEYGEALNGG